MTIELDEQSSLDKSQRWNVDFSLALENRTGKYFIGKDVIIDQKHLIANILYWHNNGPRLGPTRGDGLLRFGLKVEKRLCAHAGFIPLPQRKATHRTLYLDPFTVVMAQLRPHDIVLCHDLGPLTHPALFPPWVTQLYDRAYRKIASVHPRLVFVSISSRRAFEMLFGTEFSMSVIYPHLRGEIGGQVQTPISSLNMPFLLTAGNLGMRKNQLASIHGFARSGLAARGIRYVLCGGREPGWEKVMKAAAATPGVDVLPYVSDSELAWLYAHAHGFVLTSLLEGFGMPVAEAISRDLIPIVSRHSVLEEVAGEGAIAVDPENEAEIAGAMVELWQMPSSERGERSLALRSGIGRFTREKFAQDWRHELQSAPP